MNAGFLNVFEALPGNLADVKQAFLAGHKLYEAAVGHDAHNFCVVNLAHFGNGHDGTDLGNGGIDALFVGSRYLHLAHAVFLVDGDGCAGVFLHALDNLAARANNGADELLGNFEGDDAGHVGLIVGTRLGNGLHHLTEDMLATGLGLCKCLFENFVREAVALDVHLRGGEAFERSRGLEVHIAEVVLIAEDIREHGVFVFAGVFNQAHGDAAHGSLDGHTGVHEGERAGADGSHRAGTVGLEDIAHDAHGVGEVLGDLTLEAAPSEVSVADFAAANAALCLCLAGGEGREVVVQEEAHVALVEHVVHHLLIELRAERTGREALRFAAREDRRTVRAGQGVNLAPDGTDVRGLAAVEADAFVENAAAHSVFLYIVVVFVDQTILLFEFLGRKVGVGGGIGFLEVFADSLESVHACVLFKPLLRHLVARLIASILHLLAQFLIVHLVAIFALHVGAEFFRKFFLQAAHGLDGLVGGFERFKECAFGHFVHFAFHHHDVFFRCADHEVHVGLFELLEGGVDDIFAVDAGHAALRDRSFKGNVGAGECGGGGEAGEGVGHVHAVGREERDVHEHFCMIVGGEQGAQGAVDEARRKDFVVGGAALTLGETAGETAGGRILFFVVTLQRHEVRSGNCVLCTANSGQEHGVVHAQHNGSIGLFGKLACLDADGASIGQRHGFGNHVHLNVVFIKCKKVVF